MFLYLKCICLYIGPPRGRRETAPATRRRCSFAAIQAYVVMRARRITPRETGRTLALDRKDPALLREQEERQMSAWSHISRAAAVVLVACYAGGVAHAAPPVVGPNVNMVSGTKFPEGDPFLTKQNEPSLAASSRNSRHLLAGSNDYRLVPVEIAEELDEPEAWITLYKSLDGGTTWRSVVLGGCPLPIPQCNDATGQTAPLKARTPNFGADPTVRSGPYGTFFLSFIAGKRDNAAGGVVAVQRFVDKNNAFQRDFDARVVNCTPGTAACPNAIYATPFPDGCNSTSSCS